MALPPLAPVSALEIRLGLAEGTLSGADLARAGAALGDVSALVRSAAGSDMLAEDETTITAPDAVVTVTLQASLRVYLNPDGLQGYAVDGYSEQRPQGAIGPYLTEDEMAVITAAMRTTSGGTLGVGTVRTPSAYNDTPPDDLALWGLL